MRTVFFSGWILVPALLGALHLGLGRHWLDREDAAAFARAADQCGESGAWEEAATGYTAALAALPADAAAERRSLEVALGRALVMSGSIVEGQERLDKTLGELDEAGLHDSDVAASARYERATSSYYAAWIMRLEGATAAEWKPEAEQARQHFRLLAERASDASEAAQDGLATTFQHSLEATIRLEQMDMSELLARPLPKKCPKCKNSLCQRKRKQCASRCQSDGDKEGKKRGDQSMRQEIKKTNSAGLHSGSNTGS